MLLFTIFYFFVGAGQPCPYGQSGTTLRTCSGEYFNYSVRRNPFLTNLFQAVDRKSNLGKVEFNPTSEFTCDIHTNGYFKVQTREEVDGNCGDQGFLLKCAYIVNTLKRVVHALK